MQSDIASTLKVPGSVGIIPTDTVYGLVARAEDKVAVERLYSLKDRVRKPGTIIAADLNQLEGLGLKHRYVKAVEQYWPGPISVVIPVGNPQLVYLHSGLQSLAVRIPKDKKLHELLLKTGPLLTTSANLPAQPVAQTIKEARDYFGNKVDFYEDGGDLTNREPSTLIRIIDDAVEVIRQGSVKL